MNFYERFDQLAKQKNTSVNAVAKELGIASSTVTGWKQGSEPTQSKIQKLAEYFRVSTDYLLGLSPIKTSQSPEHQALSLELQGLTPEQAAEVKRYIQFVIKHIKE